MRGYLAVGHCRDTWWLGTAGILCGWALQGYSAVGHCRNTLPLSTAVRLRAEGGDNIDFKIQQPQTTIVYWGLIGIILKVALENQKQMKKKIETGINEEEEDDDDNVEHQTQGYEGWFGHRFQACGVRVGI